MMLPLFPLSSVLFPGGSLPLRIFEARYMDMAKKCMSDGTGFGVCLITEGPEVARKDDQGAMPTTKHEMLGCEAMIQDWDMEQVGILQVRCLGTRRFEVRNTEVQKDGLILAEIDFLDPEPDREVPAPYAALALLAQKIVGDLDEKPTAAVKRMVQAPYQFNSASWVGSRLTEFMPLPLNFKQRMMNLNDPLGRLAVLKHFLQQQGII